MIKCIGFGKSLKQLFIIGLISCFTLLGSSFVNAGYTRQIGSYSSNGYNPAIDVAFLRTGNPLTINLGYTKQLFQFYASQYYSYFFFWYDGLPYFYYNATYGGTKQGNITIYKTCDEIINSDSSSAPGNCVSYTVGDTTREMFGNFIRSLTSNDYYFYNVNYNYQADSLNFCISSSHYHSSLCFSTVWNTAYAELVNTLGLSSNLTFDTIPNSVLGNPPGYGSSSSNNTGSTSNPNIIVDNNVYTNVCTRTKALNWYENNGYSKRLCYGGLNNYDIWDGQPVGTLPVYGTGNDIIDIRFNTAGYRQGGTTGDGMPYSTWFGYRRQLYSTYKRGGYSVNPFINTPLQLFTYFGAVDTYGSNFDSKYILEYCDLVVAISPEHMNLEYTGLNKDKVCASAMQVLVDSINSSTQFGIDILGGMDGYGTGENGSGNHATGQVFTDGANFISDFYNLVSGKFGDFNKSDYGLGVLPTYIILFLMGIILFRFISH